MSSTFTISSINELTKVVNHLIELTKEHAVFVFNGEMGAGKTTLIGALCNALGIDETSSPTYSIVNTYLSGDLGEIYHFDFYRLEDEQEAVESGLDEMIDSGNICFLEWADRISKLLPMSYVKVGIEYADNVRKIEISIV